LKNLKKTNSNITGRTVSALLTEELLEKKGNNNGTVLKGAFKREMSTKTDKTDKKLNHLSFQSTEQHIPDLVHGD
jgi:hypothetical protein